MVKDPNNLKSFPFGLNEKQVDLISSALLLVKPQGRPTNPLETSDRPTQLVDIPATIYDSVGLSVVTHEGRSVLTEAYPADSTQHLFVGFFQQHDGRNIMLGQQTKQAEIYRLTWSRQEGWVLRQPPLDAKW